MSLVTAATAKSRTDTAEACLRRLPQSLRWLRLFGLNRPEIALVIPAWGYPRPGDRLAAMPDGCDVAQCNLSLEGTEERLPLPVLQPNLVEERISPNRRRAVPKEDLPQLLVWSKVD